LIFATPRDYSSSVSSSSQDSTAPKKTDVYNIIYTNESMIRFKKTTRVPSKLLERRAVTNNIFLVNNGTRLVILGGNSDVKTGEYFDLIDKGRGDCHANSTFKSLKSSYPF
jgi:hypothetical protein